MAVKQYSANGGKSSINVVDRSLSGVEANALWQATHNGSLGSGTTSATRNVINTSGSSSNAGKSQSTVAPSYSGASNVTDYQSALQNLYAQQQAQAQALAAQQRAAAESAYRSGMERLGQAWNAKTGALKDNLNSTLAGLQRQYDTSKGEVQNDANKSLREAYVNYMLNKKNLNQNLTAQGIGGGAAESTMAGMYNNYGNSRNNINTTLNDNLTSLENTYQGNISSAQQQYNSAYAEALSNYLNYQNQMEQNLAANIVGSYGNMVSSLGSLNSGYTDTLYSLLEKQAAYEYANTQNTLGLDKVSTQAVNNGGTITDYAKWLASQRANGISDSDSVRQLASQGLDANAIYQIFGV